MMTDRRDADTIDFIASVCSCPSRFTGQGLTSQGLASQGLTSRLIGKSALTAAEPGGRGISSLTANWAVSRRAWTRKYCLMISCSIALCLETWGERFVWSGCVCWNIKLCTFSKHHKVFVFYKSNIRNTGKQLVTIVQHVPLQFILWWLVWPFSCRCSGGVCPLGGGVLQKIMCYCMSLTDKESGADEKHIN